MSHVPYTEFRRHLVKYMEEVCDSRAPLHVTRQNARSVVVLSEEEYDSIMETLHLLRSPANAQHLMRSIADADAGKLTEHEIADEHADAE
jgi:antitoxin YefM